jgi:pimeloyl-ACP methyl ester carboxylesterase
VTPDTATLQTHTVGPEAGDRLLVVLGLGNRLTGANERWFLRRLSRSGFRVTGVQLPTVAADFDVHLRRPVQRVHDGVEPAAVVGHSLGGLVVAHLETEAPTRFCSPWWGFPPEHRGGLLPWLIRRCPIRARVVPVSISHSVVGGRMRLPAATALPRRLSPAFLLAIERAQRDRPPIAEDAAVFYTPDDAIVDVTSIEEAVDTEQLERFDGGHEIFSIAGRRRAVDRLRESLETGVAPA